MKRSFNNSLETLAYLQETYGSADYRDWQYLRRQFYSYETYLEAGQASLTFFGNPQGQGGTTIQDTNMPKGGSFGQNHFLLKSIRVDYRIDVWDLETWQADDDQTLASDVLLGFVQAGALELTINAREFAQIPVPFMYAPSGNGRELVHTDGIDLLTLAEGTPNTLSAIRTRAPYMTPNPRHCGWYMMDPNVLIEAEQNFTVEIKWPSGLVPVIGTDVTDDTSNPLKVGVSLDGIVFRPVQ